MAADTVGATPAGKHRDQATSIIRKHAEPPHVGSFIFVHLRMSDLDVRFDTSTAANGCNADITRAAANRSFVTPFRTSALNVC